MAMGPTNATVTTANKISARYLIFSSKKRCQKTLKNVYVSANGNGRSHLDWLKKEIFNTFHAKLSDDGLDTALSSRYYGKRC